MTTTNSVDDVCNLLKISSKIKEAVINKLNLCIGSIINDAKLAEEPIALIDIGIGSLAVNTVDMQCKFTPSKELKNAIRQAITEGVDPLMLALEKDFSDKLMNICSEVI